MEKQQMRTLRLALIAPVAVLVSCGGGSSLTTSDASSTSTDAGVQVVYKVGDTGPGGGIIVYVDVAGFDNSPREDTSSGGSSSIQKDPVLDCNAVAVSIDPWTPTIWDAAGYCWGADRKVITDIIIEMNPQIDPMNLQPNQIVLLPQGNSRNEANRTRGYDSSIGAMCLTGTCHYLEMAPTDLEGNYSWKDAMVAAEAFSTPSANDWLLPSQDALGLIYKFSSRGVGGFSTGVYWSSFEYGFDYAWVQNFNFGNQFGYSKNGTTYVRPVRAF